MDLDASQLKDESESKGFLQLGATHLGDATGGFQQTQMVDPLVADMQGPSNVDQFLSTDQLPSQSPPKDSNISMAQPQGNKKLKGHLWRPQNIFGKESQSAEKNRNGGTFAHNSFFFRLIDFTSVKCEGEFIFREIDR